MDCSLPGSSVNGIFQARVLEWGAIAFSISVRTSVKFPLWAKGVRRKRKQRNLLLTQGIKNIYNGFSITDTFLKLNSFNLEVFGFHLDFKMIFLTVRFFSYYLISSALLIEKLGHIWVHEDLPASVEATIFIYLQVKTLY